MVDTACCMTPALVTKYRHVRYTALNTCNFLPPSLLPLPRALTFTGHEGLRTFPGTRVTGLQPFCNLRVVHGQRDM